MVSLGEGGGNRAFEQERSSRRVKAIDLLISLAKRIHFRRVYRAVWVQKNVLFSFFKNVNLFCLNIYIYTIQNCNYL